MRRVLMFTIGAGLGFCIMVAALNGIHSSIGRSPDTFESMLTDPDCGSDLAFIARAQGNHKCSISNHQQKGNGYGVAVH